MGVTSATAFSVRLGVKGPANSVQWRINMGGVERLVIPGFFSEVEFPPLSNDVSTGIQVTATCAGELALCAGGDENQPSVVTFVSVVASTPVPLFDTGPS